MRALTILLKSLFAASCAIVIFGVITWQVRHLDVFLPVSVPPWMAGLGVILMMGGITLDFWCFGLFMEGRALSPHSHFPDPDVFISWGPYQYVRNPMAKGLLTVLTGWGFYKLSPSILLFAVLMAVLMHLFVVYVEEPKLERRFGESYRKYTRQVNRWIPAWGSLARSGI